MNYEFYTNLIVKQFTKSDFIPKLKNSDQVDRIFKFLESLGLSIDEAREVFGQTIDDVDDILTKKFRLKHLGNTAIGDGFMIIDRK